MKTAVKRTISALLAVILLLGAAPLTGIDFKASATSRTADEAINWVKSQVGQAIDKDGEPWYQCVDLILAYYDYLGVSRSSGDGKDYVNNTLPNGWQRLQGAQPQKGDILVYTASSSNPNGHVAIYESDRSHYHQNFNYHSYVEQVTYMYNGLSNPYWGVIRPNWSDHTHTYNASATISKAPTQTETGTRVLACSCGNTKTQTIPAIPYTTDLAEGSYAIETKLQSGALITNNGGDDYKTVYIYSGNNADQHWLFHKNSDGTYCLENYAYRGNYITVENMSMVARKLIVYQYTGGNNQRFYVIPEGNYYRLVAKNSYMTVDLSDANPANSTTIQQYEDNGSDAQRWVLKNCTPTPKRPR